MEKVKKYKKQIFTFITMFLLVTYGVFPALTAANTLLNIVGFIGALVLLVWAGLELKEYANPTEVEELKEPETELDYIPKPKTKRKPKVKKSEYPLPPHHTNVKTPKVKQTK